MAVVTSPRLRWSRPGMASRRLTGWPAARLAAIRTMRCSPPDAGRRPPSRAAMTASQSIHAIGVPSLMQAAVSMWRVKPSSCRKAPWLTISPVPASSGWMPAAAASSAALSWLVTRVLLGRAGWLLAGWLGQEVAGDERVLAGGALGDAEHQGQVQRVGPAGQCLVEDAVAADALDADAVGLQVEVDVAPGDRAVPEGGPFGDQDVPAGGVRPGCAAVVKPRPQRPVAEVAKPLGVAGDGDAPAGQVQVVKGEIADGFPACGVDGGKGDDQPLPRVGDRLLDGSDLVHGHRTAEIVVWSWCPRSLSSPALMSSAVTSRRWPRSADQRLMRGWTAVK